MKLLLTSSSFKGGGIASYAQEFINSYSVGFQMSVIIGDDSLHPITKDGVSVFHYDMDDTSENNARNVINLINNQICPDIIVNSCARLMPLINPFLNDGIKIINVSHSLRYNEADYAGFNSEYADCIIALSEYNKQYLIKTYPNLNTVKVQIVNNFVHEEANRTQLIQAKNNTEVPVIVYSGGGTAAKSPEIAYAVVRELLKTDANFKFFWLGMRTPPFKKIMPFKFISDILPEDPRLIITGRVPREVAMDISNKANVFLIPSRREGCPIALLEAMRVGCITLTSDYKNACREIIEDGANGFIIPHDDIHRFVDMILDIIQYPSKYQSIYANSYQTYVDKLSFDVWKMKMDNILLHTPLLHNNRILDFDPKVYAKFKKHLDIRARSNLRHLLFYEYLPSALPFYRYYVEFKLGLKL